ncbi:LysR family transcriptional regulator [Ferrimonas sp. YFM]|uniref:LysR family transcriptional regulator n=1 Tax=Ferrimonas sp. YFM TaxID=3028878 RepID=UPI0025735E7D|nr:LysR family transcriptional regulator [Ferrimonas sp. YFM]BDY03033.1 LysR family transcriptional regulator [Ferrimonas sp. YFM]
MSREPFASIPVLVAVVETGSFSAAAQRLGMTPSAVSKRIQAMEQSLQCQLLQRTTRSLGLTDEGHTFYEEAHQAWELVQRGQLHLQQGRQHPQGTLRLSLPMVFGRRYVAPLIPGFLADHPQVKVDLNLDDRMVDLVAEGVDLAIRIGHLPDSPQVAVPIAPCDSVLCASAAYLTRHGTPQKPAELERHNCLEYSYFRGGRHWQLGQEKVEPRGNYRVNNSEALLDALLAGTGIGQLPTFIAAPHLRSGTLIPLLGAWPLPRHWVYALLPNRQGIPAKTKQFLEVIKGRLGGDTPVWEREIPREFPEGSSS